MTASSLPTRPTPSRPDPNGDGDSTVSAADHTSTAYDRLGRVESTTDQNDTLVQFRPFLVSRKASYRASYCVILCP